MGDYLVHLAVFTGLGIGLYRQGLPPGGAWAAVALVAAVLATTLTLHRLFVGPALGQGGTSTGRATETASGRARSPRCWRSSRAATTRTCS